MSKTIGDLTQNDIGKFVTITSIVEGQRHKDFVVTGVLNYVEHGETVEYVTETSLAGAKHKYEVNRAPYTAIQVGPGYFDQINPGARVQGIDL